MNASSGFQEVKPEDLKDATLWKLNVDFKYLFSKINAIFGPGKVTLLSSPTFNTAYASGQTPTNILPPEFITKAVADKIYGTAIATVGSAKVIAGAVYGTHVSRPGPGGVSPGTLFFETDRTIIYQSILSGLTPIWVYAGGAMIGLLSGLPPNLGNHDAGFLYYATNYYHLYQWDGGAWTFAPGSESSGQITAAVPGHLFPVGAWQACDGTPATIATSIGGLNTVTTPPMTGGVFLRGVASGSYTGAIVAASSSTLLSNVTVSTSVAPTVTGISGSTGGDSGGGTVVQSGTGATVASHPHSHSVSITDPGHAHTATNVVTQPTIQPPTDANGGLPSNLGIVWYIRI